MTVSQHTFVALITRLEREARQNPAGYRLRIVLLAACGYAFIFLMVALALGLLGGIGYGVVWLVRNFHNLRVGLSAIKLGLPVGLGLLAFVGIVLRSLWVTFPEPRGLSLERGQAVPLYREIDRLREALKVPAFHRVLLVPDFNAAVVQVPRLGVLGWHRNYLLIGLPLLLTLSTDQFRAVLAHEMGHISGAHGKFGGWVYRVNRTWMQMLDGFAAEDHGGGAIFEAFFERYAPFFWAYTHSLRRAHEYEADRAAALAVGPQHVADALITSEMADLAMASRQNGGAAAVPDERQQVRWLNDALSVPDDCLNDHPSLAARLRALNQPARLPEPHDQSAADEMLGRNLIALAESVGFVVERRDAPPVSAPAAAGAFPAATPGAMPGLGGGSAGVQPAAPAVGLNGSRGVPGHADGGGGGPLRPIGG